MRTVSEETQTPSPVADQKKKGFRWPVKLKKSLKNYLSTETGLSVLIAFLSVAVIGGILCGRFIGGDNLIKSDVSTRDVYAERTLHVEDAEETNRLRYEARQMVEPTYRLQLGVDKVIMDRLVDFLTNIESIRDNRMLSMNEKTQALEKLLNQNQNVRLDIIQFLLSTRNWSKIYQASIRTTESLVNKGINSEDFRLKKLSLVRQAIPPNLELSRSEEDAVVFLVSAKLRPTLMIDENATDEAREAAASHVKPVVETYYKGDIIVRKGEKLTDLQYAALQVQGNLLSKNRLLAILGVLILSFSMLTIVWGYLYRFEHSNFFKPAYCSLLGVAMVAAVAGLMMWIDWLPKIAVEYYPIGILSLIVCIFTHPRIAILSTMMVLLLCGLVLKIPLDVLAVLVMSSMVGIFVLAKKQVPKDRNDLTFAGLSIGIATAVMILALSFLYESGVWGYDHLFNRISIGVVMGLFSGILTLGALPIVESWFKLVTPYTLLELGNHDRPMLRRMQMEAPGTFHHSIMVATLAEAAAEAVGANPILTRVGALYHDIGKVKRPLFFVENQTYFGVENPHDKLTPRLSKMVITAHPRDGIEMGKQLGLPKAIMRFMPEHHGTLVAGYFYNKAVLQEGEENVNKAQFRYPGPKPQSRETAIVMMADACESAVRALKNPTIQQVEDRVDKIIKQRVDDGQFSECPITFQDIQIVRDTFIRVLRGIQHNRIEYQQNVLEELGKKTAVDGLRQASQGLKNIQDIQSGVVQLPTRPAKPDAEKPTPVSEPLIELDSLAELQEAEEEAGPGCC